MPDILLQKTAAGQNTTLAPQAEERVVFEFDSSKESMPTLAFQGSGNSAGDDILYGHEGDDILYGGEGDDLLFAGFNDTVYGASGGDSIIFEDNFAEFSDVDLANIFMDAGNDATEMDMLLTGATDLDTVKGLLESGNIMGMEVIVDTQDASVAHKVLEDIGKNNLTNWDATDITVSSTEGTYRQFTSGDDDNKLTILVNMAQFIG